MQTVISDDARSILDHTLIRYGGYSSNHSLTLDSAAPKVISSTIATSRSGRCQIGENNSKGLRLDMGSLTLEVVDGQHNDVLIHDETNATMAQLLLAMEPPALPMALGVIHRRPGQSFETSFYAAHPTGMVRTARVADVLRQTNTWSVD